MNHRQTHEPEEILIVDDTPANLQLLSQMLADREYRVRAVTSGERAMVSAQLSPPSLILLDIKMPEMDGFRVCELLKAGESTNDIPVIFISALDDIEDKIRAFAVGGVDYITKPFHVEEVLARVQAHLCLRRLQQELQSVNDKMARELALAGEVQAGFLPSKMPDIPGWQLAATLKPARRTSGDFYDVIQLPDGRLAVLVADVVDKGVEAALFMALSWSLIRTYALEHAARPERVFSNVNDRILSDTRSSQFLSAFLGFIDPGTGEMVYCNAGHNPPLLVQSLRSGQCKPLPRTGMLLGVMDGVAWEQASVRVSPGDALVLYTDGATDAEDPQGAFFGQSRLLETVCAQKGRPAREIQAALLDAIAGFVGDNDQSDDIALVTVVREGG